MDVSLNELRELVMDREAWHVLQFMGSQRVGHDWAIELNWTELTAIMYPKKVYKHEQSSKANIFK